MEPNLPVMAKRLRSLVRVIFFMMKNNISKSKLLVDLNLTMKKRGKLAGKAFQNLIFHHNHHHHNNNKDGSGSGSGSASESENADYQLTFTAPPGEYEFSCDTPGHFNKIFPFHLITNKRKHQNSRFFSCTQAPETEEDTLAENAMVKALEELNYGAASPALPGFGRTPMVRQLRITDSPFPIREQDGDSHVDEAAEDFINRFYNQLRHQNVTPSR